MSIWKIWVGTAASCEALKAPRGRGEGWEQWMVRGRRNKDKRPYAESWDLLEPLQRVEGKELLKYRSAFIYRFRKLMTGDSPLPMSSLPLMPHSLRDGMPDCLVVYTLRAFLGHFVLLAQSLAQQLPTSPYFCFCTWNQCIFSWIFRDCVWRTLETIFFLVVLLFLLDIKVRDLY